MEADSLSRCHARNKEPWDSEKNRVAQLRHNGIRPASRAITTVYRTGEDRTGGEVGYQPSDQGDGIDHRAENDQMLCELNA